MNLHILTLLILLQYEIYYNILMPITMIFSKILKIYRIIDDLHYNILENSILPNNVGLIIQRQILFLLLFITFIKPSYYLLPLLNILHTYNNFWHLQDDNVQIASILIKWLSQNTHQIHKCFL